MSERAQVAEKGEGQEERSRTVYSYKWSKRQAKTVRIIRDKIYFNRIKFNYLLDVIYRIILSKAFFVHYAPFR